MPMLDYFVEIFSGSKLNSRVSSRGDEIEAAVHSGVRDALLSGDVDLFFKELLILLVDVLWDGLPAVENEDGEEQHFLQQIKQKQDESWINLMLRLPADW